MEIFYSGKKNLAQKVLRYVGNRLEIDDDTLKLVYRAKTQNEGRYDKAYFYSTEQDVKRVAAEWEAKKKKKVSSTSNKDGAAVQKEGEEEEEE